MTISTLPTFQVLLKRHRAALELTQEELAERARLSVQTISTLERGTRHTPHRDTVRLLAEALQLDGEDRSTFEWAARRIGPPHGDGSGVAHESLPVGQFLGALPPRSFVGREEELERIRFALETVEGGAAQFLLLAGEPGVGKTRQAQEVMLLARERRFVVGTGRCYAEDEGVLLYPLQEALHTAIATAPPHLRTSRQWSQLEQLRSLPAHGPQQRPDLPGSEPDREQRQHLYEQITDFLVGIAEEQPLALLLDDLHWADEATLELLRHLARHTRSHRILLLGTYRHTELDDRHALTRMVRDLSREGLIERMLLRRLTVEETAALVAARVGALNGADDFIDFVQRRSKGLPFYVEKMVHTIGDRYRLVRQIGAGGMGRVFEAVDTRDGRRVAAKIMLARTEADPKALQRLKQEGAMLARLEHPNLVHLYETLLEEHACCIIMELVEGESLGQLLRSQPDGARMPWGRIQNLALQVIAALECAHARGIVHRDIKPDNIVVMPGDVVKVTDFGIARLLRPIEAVATPTTTGMTMGTPLYMAPEQVQSKPVDGRSDIYSLGCVLYEMVTGRPPFVGEDPFAVAVARVLGAPQPPHEINREIPDDWEALILRMLARDPSERFQSAAALREAIAAGRAEDRGQPRTSPPAPEVARHARHADIDVSGTVEEELQTAEQAETDAPTPVPGSKPAKWRGAARLANRTVGASIAGVLLVALGAGLIASVAMRPGSARSITAAFTGKPVAIWGLARNSRGHFQNPDGVAVDPHGNVYVADAQTDSIQQLSPAGEPLAHWGSTGTGPGQFNNPGGVAIDAQGNVYMADTGNDRIQKLSPTGTPLAQWGERGSGPGQFRSPRGVAVDRQGNIFVADTDNNRIQELSSDGSPVAQSLAGAFGPLDHPNSVITDRHGNLYVGDAYDTQIRELVSSRKILKSYTTGGPGCNCAANVHAANAGEGFYPSGLAVDAYGNVYAVDAFEGLIQRFRSDGKSAGYWDSRMGPLRGKLQFPDAVAVDSQGDAYVANGGSGSIAKLSPTGSLIAQWKTTGSIGVRFNQPFGIAVDRRGNVYVADNLSDQVHELSPRGKPLGLWGSRGSANGQFTSPQAVAVDARGNVYVADAGNCRGEKLGRSDRFFDFWACGGSDQMGWLATDGEGNLYVSVATGPTHEERIVKLSPSGRSIGRWSFPFNSLAQNVGGVALDSRGNIYITTGSPDGILQKISPRGRLLARWGRPGSDPGDFNVPTGVALDSHGDVFVADTGNNRIQEFSQSGKFMRTWGAAGNGPGQFYEPNGIAVDAQDNLYVADTLNNRIQKFSP